MIIKIYALLFGSFIGSFLNVLIYRIPRGKSVVFPRSSCPKCDHKIRWFENIPIVSFIFLRGKCFGCKTKISWRYPFVELLMGLSSFLLFPQNLYPFELINFVLLFCVFAIFITHFFIDVEHHILPDSLNLYLAFLFLTYAIIHFHWKTLVIWWTYWIFRAFSYHMGFFIS